MKEYYVGKPLILNQPLFKKRIDDILATSQYSNSGTYCQELEEYVKEYLDVEYVVATGNATQALEICLAYFKIRNPFGRVLVPSFTFAASVHAISRTDGLEPHFVDIGEDYCIDIDSLERRLGNKNNIGIMPCNLFGNMCNYDRIQSLAAQHNLFVIGDSAHAFNCLDEHTQTYVGNFGDVEVFSGHPTKLCGSLENGLITTNNKHIADFARSYRNFGFKPDAGPQGEIGMIGTNAKINEISAAAYLCQLENIEDIQTHYYDVYKWYKELMPEWIPVSTPNIYYSNFSYIICRTGEQIRDTLVNYLHDKGIYARTYFQPIHKSIPYREKYGHIVLPNTERIANQVFCLPSGLHINRDDVQYISDAIRMFFS